MSQLGCDVDEMAALERMFSDEAERLVAAAAQVDSALERLDWWGDDAATFAAQWRGRGRRSLVDGATLLGRARDDVGRNRREQLAASGATGVGAGGGGGAGAGGGGSWGGGSVPAPDASASVKLTAPKPGIVVDTSATTGTDGSTTTVRTTTETLPDGSTTVTKTTVTVDASGNRVSSDTTVEQTNGIDRKLDADISTQLLAGSVQVQRGFDANASASGDHWAASADAFLGATAGAGGSVSLGKDGLVAEGSLSAFAGGSASVDGSIDYGVVGASGQLEAKAGAGAEVTGKATIGPDGVAVEVGGSAEIAATVDATASVEVAGIEGTANAGVGVGVGASGSASASFGVHDVGVSTHVSLFAGVGGEIDLSVHVDPVELTGDLIDAGSAVVDFLSPWS